MRQTRPTTVATVTLLIVGTPLGQSAIANFINAPALAESYTAPTTFPLPTSVPQGTTVQIDGSSSMAATNETLKQRFETQYPNTKVNISYGGTTPALQALRSGKIDLAAIGRLLTDQEKNSSLQQVPLRRQKIAIVVGSNNPFNQSLTIEQFAKIFRGEITNWSQVGGSPGAIRLIDRPETSDTRQSFPNYPVFKTAPFKTGASAVKLSEDSTDAMIKELGNDGIGYAITNQVMNKPGVRILSMHNTQPTNPKYPFSQPLSYVYKGANPSSSAQAYLGYATAPAGLQSIEAATSQTYTTPTTTATEQASTTPTTTATEQASTTPTTTATEQASTTPTTTTTNQTVTSETTVASAPATTEGNVPWWMWWLSVPLLGALIWWFMRNRQAESTPRVVPAATGAAVAPVHRNSRIILVPRNCQEAYAYWEISDEHKQAIRRQGGQKQALRIYDVTDLDMDVQLPHSVQQFDCAELDQDQHLPIPVDNRDYIAEIGYVTKDSRWLSVARSSHIRVPACSDSSNLVSGTFNTVRTPTTKAGNFGIREAIPAVVGTVAPATVAGATTGVFTGGLHRTPSHHSRIILVPRHAQEAYAYWELLDQDISMAQQQGGKKLTLWLYDVTDIDPQREQPHRVLQFDCHELDRDRHVQVSQSGDYIAEIGYVTDDNHRMAIATSEPVRIPAP